MLAIQFVHFWLAAAGVGCYAVAVGLHVQIVKTVNKQFPKENRLPYLLHFRDTGRAEREYKRLFPRSKLPRLALILAAAAITLLIAALVVRACELMAVG